MKKENKAKASIQKFGGTLSGMVMPNIGAFIAWGLVTAIFLETGWWPNEKIATIIGPMLNYLLPILIGYTGGKIFYDTRGGVVGAIATMGVIVGSDIPMFLGAMIMGPIGAFCIKKFDSLFEGKIKPGFEMLINNFSAGIIGFILLLVAFFGIGPIIQVITNILSTGVDFLVTKKLIPLTSIFIEPAKVLFLNNAVNHGILTPIGTAQVQEFGKSILYLLEANPGAGLGILLAYSFFGKGTAKQTAPGVAIIHFFGGIHEVYFPYILMKPIMILAAIAGSMSGIYIFQLFNVGLVSPASPGSIIAILSVSAKTDYIGLILGILVSIAVSFIIGSIILKSSKKEDIDLETATAQKDSMKKESKGINNKKLEVKNIIAKLEDIDADKIKKIVVACDAGMGSSAMGASILNDKIKNQGIEGIIVKNYSIPNIPEDTDIVITHESLTERAYKQIPTAYHFSVDNFLSNDIYDKIAEHLNK